MSRLTRRQRWTVVLMLLAAGTYAVIGATLLSHRHWSGWVGLGCCVGVLALTELRLRRFLGGEDRE